MTRRRIAILAGGLAGAAGLFLVPQAQADPSLCVSAEVEINGTVVSDGTPVCLPPAGAPGVPGAPELPAPTLPAPPSLP
jgi:hypothetical protein